MRKTILTIIIAIAIANLFLALYIQKGKVAAEAEAKTPENCFIEGSGCYTVQTSYFADTFGISNPLYGVVAFTLLGLIALWQMVRPSRWRVWAGFAVLVPGSLFALWLLQVQFFRLNATCIYCLWVDGLTLLALGLWAWLYREETLMGLGWAKKALF